MNKKLILIALSVFCVTSCSQKTGPEISREALAMLESGKIREAELLVKEGIANNTTNELRLLLAEIYLKRGEILGAQKELERISINQLSDEDIQKAEEITAHIALLNFDLQYQTISNANKSLKCSTCELTLAWAEVVKFGHLKDSNNSLSSSAALTVILNYARPTTEELSIDNIFSQSISDEELLIIADLFRRRNNVDGVIEAYSRYHKKFPNTVNIHIPYAEALLIKGRYNEADKLITATLARFSKNPVANYLKSVVLINEKKLKDALNYAALADTYGMNSSTASLVKGLLEFSLDNFESALTSFQKSVSLQPSNKMARAMLTATQVKLGVTDGALKRLSEVDNYSDIELATIGQLVGHDVDSRDWEKIQKKLLEKGTSASSLLNTVIDYTNDAKTGLILSENTGKESVFNLIQLSVLLNQNQLSAALEYVKQWLHQTDDKLTVLNYKGAIELAMGNAKTASATYMSALDIDPTNRASLMYLSQNAAKQQNYIEAMNYLSKILDDNQQDIVALKLFAAYQKSDNNESSYNLLISHIDNAIKLSENSSTFQLLKAGVFVDSGNYVFAERTIENLDIGSVQEINQYWEIKFRIAELQQDYSALKQNFESWKNALPDTSRPYIAFASYLEKQQSLTEALEVIEQVPLRKYDANHQLISDIYRFTLLVRTNNLARAEALAKNLTKYQNLPAPLPFYLQGFLSASKGNFEEAIYNLTQHYKLTNSPKSLQIIHNLYTRKGKDSSSLLEKHLNEYPNDDSVKLLLAGNKIETDTQQAISLYLEIIQNGKVTPDVLNNLAWAQFLVGDYQAALKNAQHAVAQDSTNSTYLDTLFRILTARQDFKELIKRAESATTDENKLLLANAFAEEGQLETSKQLVLTINSEKLNQSDKILLERLK